MGAPEEIRNDVTCCRRLKQHWCGFECCLFEQCWVYTLEALVLLFSVLALVFVINDSSYSLDINSDELASIPEFAGSDGNTGVYGQILYAKYDSVLEPVDTSINPTCSVSSSFEDEFSTEPKIRLAAGFVIFFISFDILSLSFLVCLQLNRGFTDIETLPSYRFRALLLFQVVMLLGTIISASILWIGLRITCDNLPKTGCFIQCCDCLQYICIDDLNTGAFCSAGSPNAVASDTFRNAVQSLDAAGNLLWVNSVFIIAIMLLFACMLGSRRTWSGTRARERAARQGTKL
mmetsp:Transcript_20926/g.25375  ORF Transcript_20926/g.25375 Transcript_20926/m.25375 type:complete len:290 (-) Transcript_20926:229-1098(-)